MAIIGRYVLPPEIFPILAETKPGKGGEIQLTDGLATLCERHGLAGLEVEGRRDDVGDRAGYVVAMVHYALKRARHRATRCARAWRACWRRPPQRSDRR